MNKEAIYFPIDMLSLYCNWTIYLYCIINGGLIILWFFDFLSMSEQRYRKVKCKYYSCLSFLFYLLIDNAPEVMYNVRREKNWFGVTSIIHYVTIKDVYTLIIWISVFEFSGVCLMCGCFTLMFLEMHWQFIF